jgi:GH24 family phage-related lysozyme (muramidase)
MIQLLRKVKKMNISQVGINLIKSFEGLELTSYKVDGAKEEYFTIGYGHYGLM